MDAFDLWDQQLIQQSKKEKTMENEIENQKFVKSWSWHSVFNDYERAASALSRVRAEKGIREAKIHKRSAGFVIKVWKGEMKPAPIKAG